jgi:LPS O-antigen subunit length determinant protein (WzzB/FepE family)
MTNRSLSLGEILIAHELKDKDAIRRSSLQDEMHKELENMKQYVTQQIKRLAARQINARRDIQVNQSPYASVNDDFEEWCKTNHLSCETKEQDMPNCSMKKNTIQKRRYFQITPDLTLYMQHQLVL